MIDSIRRIVSLTTVPNSHVGTSAAGFVPTPATKKADLRALRETIHERPLSVLLICHSYPPVIGGSEIEAQRVCAALLNRGQRIRVVCTGGEPMPPVLDWVDPKGVPVRLYAARWKGALKDIVFAIRVAAMLIRERQNYELVYFLMQGLHLAAGLPVAKLLGKPVVMKISGSGLVSLMSKSMFGRLELAFLRRWARYVMILNEGMLEEAIDHGLSRHQLVWMPNPIDTHEFAPCSDTDRGVLRSHLGIPPSAPVVMYCGRLAPEKGLSSLLDAFAIARRTLPNAVLVLIGDGTYRAELEDHVSRLNVTANVRFAGSVHPSQVAYWLKIADVFTLVSPAEGFPCAVAEAMSTGIPCVVSDIPANRQLIKSEEHGLLVPLGEPNEIAAAIVRLLNDPSLRARMGQAARGCIVENYATDRVAKRYERLFQSVLKRIPFRSDGELPVQYHDSSVTPALHNGVEVASKL